MSAVYTGKYADQPLPMEGLRDHPSLQERAYQVIREAILDSRYKPGERLYEVAIAEALGISRNPVREGIRRLQQEGLVIVKPRSGVFVATLSSEEAKDLYRVRAALEGVAAALAAERISQTEREAIQSAVARMHPKADQEAIAQAVDDFHATVRRAADSTALQALLQQVFVQVSRFKDVAFVVDFESAYEDHKKLLEMILRGDADSAERAMHAHVLQAYARAREASQTNRQSRGGRTSSRRGLSSTGGSSARR